MSLILSLSTRWKSIVWVLFSGAWLLLWLVYAGSGVPLSAAEVDDYMRRIQAQQQQPGGRHDLPALREFLASDDGAPFYTVNLYRYHDRAQYLNPNAPSISGREAYDQFSAIMIRLLARQASHPVFGTRWISASGENWDRLVIVRYRSRRDIAELFASNDFAEASAHKWASLAGHNRLLVQGRQVPDLRWLLLLPVIGTVAWMLGRWRRHRSST